jgi:hypothetical protein
MLLHFRAGVSRKNHLHPQAGRKRETARSVSISCAYRAQSLYKPLKEKDFPSHYLPLAANSGRMPRFLTLEDLFCTGFSPVSGVSAHGH